MQLLLLNLAVEELVHIHHRPRPPRRLLQLEFRQWLHCPLSVHDYNLVSVGLHPRMVLPGSHCPALASALQDHTILRRVHRDSWTN